MLNLQNIHQAKNSLLNCDPSLFNNSGNSYTQFLNKIEVEEFRNIKNLNLTFDCPITILTGTNKIGKTSLLLLICCSYYEFMRFDSTKPETILRRHTWKDVLPFTNHENTSREYGYKLEWRLGNSSKNGFAKRNPSTKAWTGVGKASSDPNRMNAQIKNRQVRFIDLERIAPARNSSNSLLRKITYNSPIRLNSDIEQAFAYIFDYPSVEIFQIGSHINKSAFLISNSSLSYSSYNAASGEESLINILIEIFDVPNDSLIIIDELEAGFHPYIQRKIADVISYISWTQKKQFIITTHSPSLLASFPQKARKFIDKKDNGDYEVISKISVNAAFSRMDSQAYPLIQLYCEDNIAEYMIKNLLIELNSTNKYFDRLVNIIKSGPIDQVKNDYERHKRNYNQMRLKIGYACVFDGDHKTHPHFSSYFENPNEFSFFLYPYLAPEKFLVRNYLINNPNAQLNTALEFSDHHSLFREMVNLGLATDENQALHNCWSSFKNTPDYNKLSTDFKLFIINTVRHFSEINE
ncbi:ATP-dependent nuclease [Soonwooa sp.]|uniref:ATP-dependent nuclease n=1 Tax=Soonwooa sp. TaxID=1938592 RepID=UPI00289E3D11|nr:AAA family ATPase [Soonwooa sp.]